MVTAMIDRTSGPFLVHLDRGVWTAPYLIRGCEALEVVSSTGERIAEVRIPHETDKSVAIRHLEGLLDTVDPLRPTLTLLRSHG
jgi:hypothetical protein